MDPDIKPIEKFFLESLLKVCLVSILIVITVDFYFTRFALPLSLIVNGVVLFAILSAFIMYRLGYFRFTVVWIGSLITCAMYYQSIFADSITTSSMAVVMVVGFGYSVLLKGLLSRIMHCITLSGMISIFSWQTIHPQDYNKENANDIIVAGVTYCTLYLIIAYSSAILKKRYDEVFKDIALKNIELVEKTHEIEAQNEELVQSQENLNQLNNHLESLVEARTREVQRQNQQLIQYAFANAHHLRGPVARLLGLLHLAKIESHVDFPHLFKKIEEQAVEIDGVVKRINTELEN